MPGVGWAELASDRKEAWPAVLRRLRQGDCEFETSFCCVAGQPRIWLGGHSGLEFLLIHRAHRAFEVQTPTCPLPLPNMEVLKLNSPRFSDAGRWNVFLNEQPTPSGLPYESEPLHSCRGGPERACNLFIVVQPCSDRTNPQDWMY